MARTKRPSHPIPTVSAKDAQAMVAWMDEIIATFQGDFDELENAIGMYMIGRLVGWKVLVLIHNKRTIRKYEEILEIDVREAFDPEGPFSDKSQALQVVNKIGNFWKAVSGELKDEGLRDGRRKLA